MAQLTTQPTPLSDSKPTLRLPIGRIALLVVASPLAIGALTAAASWPRFGVGSIDAIVGGAVFALAALLGVAILKALNPTNVATAGHAVLFVSAARLGAAIAMGVALYLVRQPTPVPYWVGFLLAGLACLVIETTIATSAIKKAGLNPDRDSQEQHR